MNTMMIWRCQYCGLTKKRRFKPAPIHDGHRARWVGKQLKTFGK